MDGKETIQELREDVACGECKGTGTCRRCGGTGVVAITLRNSVTDDEETIRQLREQLDICRKANSADKAALRSALSAITLYKEQVGLAINFLQTHRDAMYECVYCGATKEEENHREGCKMQAAIDLMERAIQAMRKLKTKEES